MKNKIAYINDHREYMIRTTSGEFVAVHPEEVIQTAERVIDNMFSGKRITLTNPDHVRPYLRTRLAARKNEHFAVLFLDSQHQLISFDEMFHGTVNSAAVYPRPIVEAALLYGASAVILAHNHPSGQTQPSVSDQQITVRIQEALALLEIQLLDHFIVGEDVFSFAEAGMI